MKVLLIAIIAITAAGTLLAEQGAAAAAPPIPTPRQLASDICKTEKGQLSRAAFRKRYGAHPMRGCVKKQMKAARQALYAATATCDDELAVDGPLDFIDTYADDDGTGAYENCVIDAAQGLLDDSSGGGSGDDEV